MSVRGPALLDGLAAVENESPVAAVATERASLEQVFMDLVTKADGGQQLSPW